MPSCTDTAGNHLNYTPGTGLSCGNTSSGGGSGGAGIVFAGTTTGSSNAYALAATGFTLTDGWMVSIIPNFTNTTAATLNVQSTGATAIKAMSNTGTPVALKGGELVWSGTGSVGNSYLLRYSSAAAAFIIQDPPPSGGTIGATTTTITQAQWQSFHVFVVTTAAQTFTLPVATALSPGGGILIQTVGVTTTLTPNAADGIKTGSGTPTVAASVTIPSDVTVIASTTGSSGATAFNLPLGQTLSLCDLMDQGHGSLGRRRDQRHRRAIWPDRHSADHRRHRLSADRFGWRDGDHRSVGCNQWLHSPRRRDQAQHN